MSVRLKLEALATAIADQAERDPAFAATLTRLFASQARARTTPTPRSRQGRRRAAAVLDPVALARESDSILRAALDALDLSALRDIVADHGMDPNRKIARWRTKSKVIEEIVTLSTQRARKGDSFRTG